MAVSIAMAPRIVWSASLSVGVREIDADHQCLLLLYEELRRMMKSSRGGDMLQQALVDLDEYTRSHFAREEAWMRGFRYPGLAAHTYEHAELTKQVAALRRSEGRDGTTLVAVQTLRLLGRWIPQHVLQTDQRAAGYLKTAEPHLMRERRSLAAG